MAAMICSKKVTRSGGSPFLEAIGKMAIVGSYYYDVFHGLKLIHDNREAVRFKYGKQLKLSLRPSYDFYANEAKINFDLSF